MAWSDAAREAAAEARKAAAKASKSANIATAKAKTTGKAEDHAEAAKAHGEAANAHEEYRRALIGSGDERTTAKAAEDRARHDQAFRDHRDAADSLKGSSQTFKSTNGVQISKPAPKMPESMKRDPVREHHAEQSGQTEIPDRRNISASEMREHQAPEARFENTKLANAASKTAKTAEDHEKAAALHRLAAYSHRAAGNDKKGAKHSAIGYAHQQKANALRVPRFGRD